MSYELLILKKAQKELSVIPQKEFDRIKKSIFELAEILGQSIV